MENDSPVAFSRMRRRRRPVLEEGRESLRRKPWAKAQGNSSGWSPKERSSQARKRAGSATRSLYSSLPTGRQTVEQRRAKRHLRAVRFYSKVILGPSLPSVPWTPVYILTPPQTPGRSAFFTWYDYRNNPLDVYCTKFDVRPTG